MNKNLRGIIIVVCSFVCFYLGYYLFEGNDLGEYISVICFFIPIVIYLLVIKNIIKREDIEVSNNSVKIRKIEEVNNRYSFKKISKNKHKIYEREYSRRSLDRVTGNSIIRYNIENNIDNIRSDIESALYNINLLEDYNKDIDGIINSKTINNSKYKDSKFYRIEKRIVDSKVVKKEDFYIIVKLEVNYRSNGGKVNESRYGKYNFDELVKIYNEWNKGKKYTETVKQERKIMNDDIRYNVLKRDNYTCKICGAKASDGAKLHVDHIIPVSKGGKTVMSNLQTLCDRCNMGKSNKMDDDMVCPKCGGSLVERKGKYGKFLGCSNYPKCRYVKNDK